MASTAATELLKPLTKVAQSAFVAGKQPILDQCKDTYREDEVKKALLSVCEQIQDDTKALRNESLKTALQAMQSWHDSSFAEETEYSMKSPTNIKLLEIVLMKAREAFNLVSDAGDKIKAVSLLIYAHYHHVALTLPMLENELPDWTAGKRSAQRLLKQYVNDMPQLKSAAKEEIDCCETILNRRANKEKRRMVLRDYASLTAAVFYLQPMSENVHHPKFVELDDAVVHLGRKTNAMLGIERGPITASSFEIGTLKGHKDSVDCCVVFAQGTRMVSASWDNTLKVWDLANGKVRHTLRGHAGWVFCCTVFAQDTRVVSGSDDNTLKLWDLSNGKEICTLEGHTDCVRCCSVFEQDTMMVSGSLDNTLKVWDLSFGECIYTLHGHTDSVYCCSVFDQDTRVLSGSLDTTLKVWDLTTGKEIYTLDGHENSIYCCSVFAQDTRVVSGSLDNTLKIWDLVNRKEICTLEGHTNDISCCSVFAQDTRLVSGSLDNTLKIWDLITEKEIYTLNGHKGCVSCCCVFAQGTRVISGSWDNTLKVWDLTTGEGICTLEGHKGSIWCCSVFTKDTRVVSASHDNTLKVWVLPYIQ